MEKNLKVVPKSLFKNKRCPSANSHDIDECITDIDSPSFSMKKALGSNARNNPLL
jgi:hypothetical protein